MILTVYKQKVIDNLHVTKMQAENEGLPQVEITLSEDENNQMLSVEQVFPVSMGHTV